MKEFFAPLLAVLRKDLIREARTGETLLGGAAFGIVVVLVFAFARPSGSMGAQEAVGAVWIAILFASQIGIARSVDVERQEGRLEAIRSTGLDPGLFYISKVVSLFLFLAAMATIILGVATILFTLDPEAVLHMAGIFAAGIAGIAMVGPLLTFVAAATRLKEILAPFLFLILFVPLILTGVMAAQAVLEGDYAAVSLKALLGFDLIVGGAVLLLAPIVIED